MTDDTDSLPLWAELALVAAAMLAAVGFMVAVWAKAEAASVQRHGPGGPGTCEVR